MAKKTLNKNARKWVNALRSGKYGQCTGQLKTENGDERATYCCLGVACELAVKAKVIRGYGGSEGGLPEEVKDWLGISDELGRFDKRRTLKGTTCIDLTDLNDGAHCSFKQIARFIESKPEGLFVD